MEMQFGWQLLGASELIAVDGRRETMLSGCGAVAVMADSAWLLGVCGDYWIGIGSWFRRFATACDITSSSSHVVED